MNWFTYLKLGALVFGILKKQFPQQLEKVPVDDIVSVVTELITTTATVQQAKVIQEPMPRMLASGQPLTPTRPQYRLVLGNTP